MIYEPKKGHYITYHYHYPSEVVSFDSRYIAKIIDYGRSYFNDKESNLDSLKIRNTICNIKECNPDCGLTTGYGWLTEIPRKSHIASAVNNISHDLRLLHILKKVGDPLLAVSLFMKLVFTDKYGTANLPNTGLPRKINNVIDAFDVINDLIKNSLARRVTQYTTYKYAKDGYNRIPMKKMGDLHVYMDGTNRPMRFTEI